METVTASSAAEVVVVQDTVSSESPERKVKDFVTHGL